MRLYAKCDIIDSLRKKLIYSRGRNTVIIQNKKANSALNNLLSRQDYLVTQANDLARAFGNLTAFQHKVLDYCFSYVQKDDHQDKIYEANLLDVIHHLGLQASGDSYKRVVEALRALDLKTSIYMRTIEPDGRKGILMTHLFDHVKVIEDGKFEFRFSRDVEPYVFQLKSHFYSFKLSELTRVRSKYTLTMMKLWNANSLGKLTDTTIQGSLEDWETWFLGSNDKGEPKHWSAGIFKRDVINKALKELGQLYPQTLFRLTTIKNGRNVVGYTLDIHSVNTNTHLDIT